MEEQPFLYKQIYEDIAGEIYAGKRIPGDKIPTEQELAVQYGVSRITSKRALNILAEQGLVVRRRGLGTFVAPRAASPESSTRAQAQLSPLEERSPRRLGVIMEDVGESYSQGLLYAIDKQATEAGFQIRLALSYGDQQLERTRLREVLSDNVEGLLIMPAHGSYYDTDLLRLVLAHFPVVLIDRPLTGIPAPSVYSDNEGSTRALAELLIRKGHRYIGYASPEISETISLEDRYSGYVQALRANGMVDIPPFNVSKIIRFVPSISRLCADPVDPPEQLALMAWLRENPQITAVIGAEYGVAHLLRRAAVAIGRRVPEDLAICCFDEKYGYLGEYEFTHIKQDEAAIANTALAIMQAMLDGQNMRRQSHVIATHLLEGATT